MIKNEKSAFNNSLHKLNKKDKFFQSPVGFHVCVMDENWESNIHMNFTGDEI